MEIPRLPIIIRSEIGLPATASGAGPLGHVRGIVVHHTAQGFSYAAQPGATLADGTRALKEIRRQHIARKFGDVGYHFVIDGAGRIYQGRAYARAGSFGPGRTPPALALGTHVKNHNTGRIGVNVLGCFGGKGAANCGDTPSPAALASLTDLLRVLTAAYGVSPANIVGHRDLAPNVCPGDRLYAELPGIRAALK